MSPPQRHDPDTIVVCPSIIHQTLQLQTAMSGGPRDDTLITEPKTYQ
jgi:hypothetical protein